MGGGIGSNFGKTRGSRANSKIHKDRQDKHIEGTKNYKQQINNGKHPSILKENPDKLLKEGAGKGKMTTPTKESVDFGRVIGKYYDKETGKYYETTRGTIHYDSKGNAHIVPARPNGFK
ncbi:MAG: transposase [Clostridiales bacterium]|nr:transposase [Clostridiales bacterium]